MQLEKVVYTAHATATGGRNGYAKSSDGALDVKLTAPTEMGGSGAEGANPEQLFAAGYAACFIGAMQYVAQQQKIDLPEGLSIDAAVSIGPIPVGFNIAVDMQIKMPGMDKSAAEAIVEAAHQVCPYSNATRNNIAVNLAII